ncbi:hypothetical protein D3C73_1565920 [compost metagenome]
MLPIFSGVACLWLMTNLTTLTWLRFLVWVVIGLVLYASFGYRNSLLSKRNVAAREAAAAAGAPGEAGAPGDPAPPA